MTTPISAIGGISPVGATTGPSSATGVQGAGSATGGGDFASVLGKGLDSVSASQGKADSLAVQAATGQLVDPAALTVAMTQAQLMTQLMTTVQSKAVTSFNTIMGMQA